MTLTFLADIESELASWPGETIINASHVRGHNIQHGKHTVFWCSQTSNEFSALNLALGDDFTLYGLRSGHLVMEYTPDNIDTLTDLYAQQINCICVNKGLKKITLGGNCQGAGLMLVVAQKLAQLGQLELSVIVLESIIPKRLSVPVTLIFGRYSTFNPYKRYRNVEIGLSSFYKEFNIGIIPGSHGQFFRPENVGYIAQFLKGQQHAKNVISRTQSTYCATHEGHTVEVENVFKQMRLVNLTFDSSNITSCSDTQVTILLENAGLSKIDANQFFLANQWHIDGSRIVYQWLDANAVIPLLQPGDQVKLSLRVRAPLSAGKYLLKFRLTTAGVGFQEFDKELPVEVHSRPLHFKVIKPNKQLSSRKALIRYVRSGCIDDWVNGLLESPSLTRRQWHLMVTMLAKEERWNDICSICSVLNVHHLGLSLSAIYIEALIKIGEEKAALSFLEQEKNLHNYKIGSLNKLYLQALLNTGDVQLAYQKLYQTTSFSVVHKGQVLLLLLNSQIVKKLTSEQVEHVAADLYENNKGVGAFLKITNALMVKKLNNSAFDLLTKAVALFPHNTSFKLRLAHLNDLLGNKHAALLLYQQVLDVAPGNQIATQWLTANNDS